MKKYIIAAAVLAVLAFGIRKAVQPKTGWVKMNGDVCYLDEEGNRKTGWVFDNHHRYYMDENDVMVTGDYELFGTKVHFNDKGEFDHNRSSRPTYQEQDFYVDEKMKRPEDPEWEHLKQENEYGNVLWIRYYNGFRTENRIRYISGHGINERRMILTEDMLESIDYELVKKNEAYLDQTIDNTLYVDSVTLVHGIPMAVRKYCFIGDHNHYNESGMCQYYEYYDLESLEELTPWEDEFVVTEDRENEEWFRYGPCNCK